MSYINVYINIYVNIALRYKQIYILLYKHKNIQYDHYKGQWYKS